MDSYRASKAWHLSQSVAVDLHAHVSRLKKSEVHRIHHDMKHLSAWVPLHIQTGLVHEKHHRLEHYTEARETAAELQEVLMSARDYKLIEHKQFNDLAKRTIEAQKLLTDLIRAINRRSQEAA